MEMRILQVSIVCPNVFEGSLYPKLLGRNGFHRRRYCIDNGGVLVTILLSQFQRRNPS